jgi:hypothetical protein
MVFQDDVRGRDWSFAPIRELNEEVSMGAAFAPDSYCHCEDCSAKLRCPSIAAIGSQNSRSSESWLIYAKALLKNAIFSRFVFAKALGEPSVSLFNFVEQRLRGVGRPNLINQPI